MTEVKLATVTNVWVTPKHVCYFCRPELYPPMLPEHTLCARCGDLIVTPGVNDPRNESLFVCPDCDEEIELELCHERGAG